MRKLKEYSNPLQNHPGTPPKISLQSDLVRLGVERNWAILRLAEGANRLHQILARDLDGRLVLERLRKLPHMEGRATTAARPRGEEVRDGARQCGEIFARRRAASSGDHIHVDAPRSRVRRRLLRGDRHESHRFLRVFGSHEVGELEAREGLGYPAAAMKRRCERAGTGKWRQKSNTRAPYERFELARRRGDDLLRPNAPEATHREPPFLKLNDRLVAQARLNVLLRVRDVSAGRARKRSGGGAETGEQHKQKK